MWGGGNENELKIKCQKLFLKKKREQKNPAQRESLHVAAGSCRATRLCCAENPIPAPSRIVSCVIFRIMDRPV